MTLRGRLTVVGALASAVVAALLVVDAARDHAPGGDPSASTVRAAPAVSAAGRDALPSSRGRPVPTPATAPASDPVPRKDVDRGSLAPLAILERLPITRDVVERVPLAEPDPDGPAGPHPGPFGLTPDGRMVEWVPPPPDRPDLDGLLRIEYTLDADLMRRVFRVLKRARVGLGHVIAIDPEEGRVLAYASTDPDTLPATRVYPAASLVKVVTAAAALRYAPERARETCVYRGSPYRLTRARLTPPRTGRESSLERALAASNNQCFARLAVHAVGGETMMRSIARFGFLDAPGPGHPPGRADPGADDLDLGRLGSGLGGARITPLHAAQLAATLSRGELVRPRWIESVRAADGRELALPGDAGARSAMPPELAAELRAMLVRTTTRGTARHAFRDRRGRPVLGDIRVAGKTGSLTGLDPPGKYEWFIGVAPAERPRVAIAVLQVHGDLWWKTASQIGAEVLREIFCEGRTCRASYAGRFLPEPAQATGDVAALTPTKGIAGD